ncbi:hypothetical protein IMX07_02395 [bacterium]|nr:hypothetical protein [bacterium]
MEIDYSKLTPQELKTLLTNLLTRGNLAIATAVVIELDRRGAATRREYRTLKWNQESVCVAMKPFSDIAAAVNGNRRTSYTEAGGKKIGRKRNDPDWFWIDTYSAIKTPLINAEFVCYIKQAGEEPEFQLHINGENVRTYNADQLDEALADWRATAAQANI